MTEIIITLIIIIGAIANARVDADLIEQGKYIKTKGHVLRACIRFVLIAGLSLFIFPYDWIQYGLMIAIGCAWFWIVFDIAINVMLGRDPFYIGDTAWTDRILKKMGSYYAMFFKFALLMVFIFGYIWYFDSII